MTKELFIFVVLWYYALAKPSLRQNRLFVCSHVKEVFYEKE